VTLGFVCVAAFEDTDVPVRENQRHYADDAE
jgi:hypothetical protein